MLPDTLSPFATFFYFVWVIAGVQLKNRNFLLCAFFLLLWHFSCAPPFFFSLSLHLSSSASFHSFCISFLVRQKATNKWTLKQHILALMTSTTVSFSFERCVAFCLQFQSNFSLRAWCCVETVVFVRDIALAVRLIVHRIVFNRRVSMHTLFHFFSYPKNNYQLNFCVFSCVFFFRMCKCIKCACVFERLFYVVFVVATHNFQRKLERTAAEKSGKQQNKTVWSWKHSPNTSIG